MISFQCTRRSHCQRGLTLVELMVALTIGLFIALLIGGIYLNSRQSSRYQDATARLQENARYAMDAMSREIRNAGYNGCGTISQVSNVVTGGSANWWLNLSSPIIGYEGGVSTFPTQMTNPTPVAGTDAFISVGVDPSSEINVISHNPNSAQINTTTHSLQPGTILVITDCGHTAVFQMSGPTNNNNNASNVVHNTGNSISPGNCYKALGASCGAGAQNYTFQPGASLMKMTANGFYIGVSSSGVGRSLFSVPLPSDGSAPVAMELIEGVDDMQIDYGEDTDGDGAPNRYVKADGVSNWAKVATVRISLLLSTLDDNLATKKQTYSYNGTSTTASDRRVRRTYTSVINLRNRAS